MRPPELGLIQAVKWYRLGAEQGDANAQLNLGVMYEICAWEPQDYVEAHKWYHLASAGLSESDNREKAVKGRDHVAEGMTPEELAEAQKLAREWKPQDRLLCSLRLWRRQNLAGWRGRQGRSGQFRWDATELLSYSGGIVRGPSQHWVGSHGNVSTPNPSGSRLSIKLIML